MHGKVTRSQIRLSNREALPLTFIGLVACALIMVIDSSTTRYILGAFVAILYIAGIRVLVLRKRRNDVGGS